jgi:hypothetical protein
MIWMVHLELVLKWAMGRLRFLTLKYLATNLFWKCWDENWLFNSHVWMVEF